MRLHGPHALIGVFENMGENKFRIRAEKTAFVAAKYVTSPSAYALKYVRNRYNPIWLENDIIPNPISAISNEDIWVENKYQQYQIIFVGRFDSVKGADVAILGFAKLLKTIPNARLIFSGPDRGIAGG